MKTWSEVLKMSDNLEHPRIHEMTDDGTHNSQPAAVGAEKYAKKHVIPV